MPLWIDQIKAGKPLTITEPEMTRFVMSLEEAVDLVLFAFEHGESGDILVQKAPACTIAVLAQAVRELFCPEAETRVIGIRHGEKLYETLLTNEECAHALDLGCLLYTSEKYIRPASPMAARSAEQARSTVRTKAAGSSLGHFQPKPPAWAMSPISVAGSVQAITGKPAWR